MPATIASLTEPYSHLAPLLKDYGVKVPRIAKRLRQASTASRLHSATILHALKNIVPAVKNKQLQELYRDLEAESRNVDLNAERLRIRLDRAERWQAVCV